jgi:hypothetical protein
MTANLLNPNHTELSTSNTSCETSAITTTVPQVGQSGEPKRHDAKRRESFISALMRAFTTVAC